MPASAACTDIGMVRDHNEDAVLADDPVYAVADGVGGAAAGEVASGLAIRTLGEARAELAAAASSGSADQLGKLLTATIGDAHRRIRQLDNDPGRAGMSTTLTAAVTMPDDRAVIAHVGDSRAYLLDDTGIRQLTDDHSLVGELVRSGSITAEEARHHPQSNVILQALGGEQDLDVESRLVEIPPGAVLLLCSDGLNGEVADAQIASIVADAESLEAAAVALVAAANDAGGPDNISVVLVRLADGAAAPAAATVTDVQPHEAVSAATPPAVAPVGPQRRRGLWLAGMAAAVIAAILLGAMAWSQAYFLAEDDRGNLAVFRGFPVAGMHDTWRSSDLDVDDLSSFERRQYVDRARLRSRENADQLFEELLENSDAERPDGPADQP